MEYLSFSDEEYSSSEEYTAVDSLQVYLNEIGLFPRLSAEEEAQLALSRERGKTERLKLSPNQRVILDGEEAQRRLIEANLRLVVSVVRKYSGPDRNMLDLIQIGNLGLIRAVEKFDYTKGIRFSTYAVGWIRSTIQRFLVNEDRVIRLPEWFVAASKNILKKRWEHYCSTGVYPIPEQLAQISNETLEHVQAVLLEQHIYQHMLSLDEPLYPDVKESPALVDTVEDPEALQPETYLQRAEVTEQIIALLTAREWEIIRRHLVDEEPTRSIAKTFGISATRVSQIKDAALSKLRRGLVNYM